MKQRWMRLLSILLCALLFIPAISFPAQGAPRWPSDVSAEADGAIVMDADTGAILYGKNINEAYFPASITKLLTAQIILDRCKPDETVTFSRNAVYNVESGSKSLGIDMGDQLSVEDCLYGMLLHSANEVANALAEHAGGTIEGFAKLMNQKARELGCTNSNFVLPSGLNDENHYTSAYDMALIARAALKYPEIVKILGTRIYEIPPTLNNPEGRRISPGHKMLKELNPEYYPEVFGGKTGYTSLAGNTLVTYAKKDGMTLVVVILNGYRTHYADTKTLLDFGFANFQSLKITDYDTVYQSVKDDLTIEGVMEDKALLLLDEESRITLPKGAQFGDAVSKITYDRDADTPEGVVATVVYTYGGKYAGHAYLKMNPKAQPVKRSSQPGSENEGQDGQDNRQGRGNQEGRENQQGQGNQEGRENQQGQENQGSGSGTDENGTKDGNENEKKDSGITLPFEIEIPLPVMAGAAAVLMGSIGWGIYRLIKRRREEEARRAAMRRRRREQWLRESGISADEFEQLLEQRQSASMDKRHRKGKH